eukprot:scaffold23476_cov53-Attheya_sp.AAC.8
MEIIQLIMDVLGQVDGITRQASDGLGLEPPGRKRFRGLWFVRPCEIQRGTNTTKSKVFEATMTGQIVRLPEYASALSRMERWAAGWESDRRIPLWQEGMPVYGIVIGMDESTSIEKVGEANYLDGDIWVAVEKDGKESMVSRFGDLSNEKDVQKMIGQMREEIGKDTQVIFQFDQIDKPFGEVGYSEIDFAQPFLG